MGVHLTRGASKFLRFGVGVNHEVIDKTRYLRHNIHSRVKQMPGRGKRVKPCCAQWARTISDMYDAANAVYQQVQTAN